MSLIQILTYPGRTREQKESSAKAITNEAIEILKSKRQHLITITSDQRLPENCYISVEQSPERRNFGISRRYVQHKEI
jgi:phenylpyruvate tautomerase PptA (4-oxalocrotonate tautomerase family)